MSSPRTSRCSAALGEVYAQKICKVHGPGSEYRMPDHRINDSGGRGSRKASSR